MASTSALLEGVPLSISTLHAQEIPHLLAQPTSPANVLQFGLHR
jgi:hypothetical protein